MLRWMFVSYEAYFGEQAFPSAAISKVSYREPSYGIKWYTNHFNLSTAVRICLMYFIFGPTRSAYQLFWSKHLHNNDQRYQHLLLTLLNCQAYGKLVYSQLVHKSFWSTRPHTHTHTTHKNNIKNSESTKSRVWIFISHSHTMQTIQESKESKESKTITLKLTMLYFY